MTRNRFCCAVACVLFAWAQGGAAEPGRLPDGPDIFTAQPAKPPAGKPGEKPAEPPRPPAPEPAPPSPFAQPPSEIAEAPIFNPHILGDYGAGVFVLRMFSVPALQTTTILQARTQTTFITVPSFTVSNQTQFISIPNPAAPNEPPTRVPVTTQVVTPTTAQVPVTTTTQVPLTQTATVLVPATVRVVVPFQGAFKIAENEGARPEDRVFVGYNFYSNVTGPTTPAALPHTDTVVTTIDGSPATVSTAVPGVAPPRADVHREVFGFEKTFLDGDASFELRAPALQTEGIDGLNADDFGDLTLITKFALLNDRESGDVLSAGLAVTVPTGPGIALPDRTIHPTLLQPFVGYLWNAGRLYLHGFTSVAVPTDVRDVTLLFNDVGVGYVLYESRTEQLVRAVVPTVEVHVTTPLNHRNDTDPVIAPDLVTLTAGAQIELFRNAVLSVGVATPVTGPRPFDVEALVQLNYRF